ncbi:NAD(P)/FAD-dependent oxidoreductase [Herbiconiux sp. YIM B11900]|uniref:NAD(P)/FAD-dependent oxidoreductase n=1 Tax=Herbiconiux sp. YIM B11900 TaxID=3404131 RepID=UPI003F82A323
MTTSGSVLPEGRPLESDLEVDVAIVGGGLSGLWTAWALTRADPGRSVAVLEAGPLGFGASGRNGGWLSAKPVGLRKVLARESGGREGVLQVDALLRESMHDVVGILGAEAIGARHGGWTQIARSPSEVQRIESYLRGSRAWGVTEEQLELLDRDQALERVRVAGTLAALHSPDNYCVDPAALLARLAEIVTEAGVVIHPHSEVTEISEAGLRIGSGSGSRRVRADRIVVATEGYTSRQPGRGRAMLPLNSSMLVTEPLSDAQWAAIGWSHADGISGSAHTYFYGQRTPDGRIAIGGRGTPYRFASGFDRRGRVDARTVDALSAVLRDLFPDVELEPAHAWCGVLGVPRDWTPYIHREEGSRIIRFGGYAGQGLTAAHLAGRIVADLLLDRSTALTALPWVRRPPRSWEPEPLRWLGANGLYAAYGIADRLEARGRSGRTSVVAKAADAIAGR